MNCFLIILYKFLNPPKVDISNIDPFNDHQMKKYQNDAIKTLNSKTENTENDIKKLSEEMSDKEWCDKICKSYYRDALSFIGLILYQDKDVFDSYFYNVRYKCSEKTFEKLNSIIIDNIVNKTTRKYLKDIYDVEYILSISHSKYFLQEINAESDSLKALNNKLSLFTSKSLKKDVLNLLLNDDYLYALIINGNKLKKVILEIKVLSTINCNKYKEIQKFH